MSQMMMAALFGILSTAASKYTSCCPGSCCQEAFEAFTTKYGRTYATEEERARRYDIFEENIIFVEAQNMLKPAYTLGINVFSDLTHNEWKEQFLSGGCGSSAFSGLPHLGDHTKSDAPLPASVDWSAKGAVTPVKDQGSCGSCWTFSATGALEGAAVIAGRPPIVLSEENILDCDQGGQNCSGGDASQAFQWAQENGLCSARDYPYACHNMTDEICKASMCDQNCEKVIEPGAILGYTSVVQTEGALESAVAQQPVSVGLDATAPCFKNYAGGVLTSDQCGTKIDHAVLIVGYGTDPVHGDYWKVKNSWGPHWGEDGYIRIERGVPTPGGECGIRMHASYPTVAKSTSPPSSPAHNNAFITYAVIIGLVVATVLVGSVAFVALRRRRQRVSIGAEASLTLSMQENTNTP